MQQGIYSSNRAFSALFKREPSRPFRLAYTVAIVAAYLLVFYALRDALPEKFFRDTNLLADLIRTQIGGDESYGAMVAIYEHIPGWFLPHLPALVGVISLVTVLSFIRSFPMMILMPLLIGPFILFNFMAPSKETLVAVLVLTIYRICHRPGLSPALALGLVILLYAGYGAFVRQYYLLILAAFLTVIIVARAPSVFWVPFLAALTVALIVTPSSLYMKLQSPRDIIALAQERAEFGHEVRTYFYNLLPPTNLISFLVNTLWGVLVLVCPFVVAISLNEVAMFLNVGICIAAALTGLKHIQGSARLPFILFFCHIVTLAQFEPDLGSYLRHFSSVMVYIAPGFAYLFRPPEPPRPAIEAAATA